MLNLTKWIRRIRKMTACIKTHHIGAYAAQAAFFFVLSLIPILLLLLTLVQYTPVTKQAVTDALLLMFPSTVEGLMLSIIDQVYAQSVSVIPVTLLVALWTAGKGVLAMTSGLNIIYENTETRNYIYLRIRASFYIIIFILAIILSLTLSVFGNTISIFVYQHLRILSPIVDFIIRIRTHFTLIVLTIFWELVYKYLPNRTNLANTKITTQLPGAIFTAIGWLLISFVFSIYLDIFKGFSNMYGSLTTIILIMLWLYFCMYTILLGGTLNTMLEGWNWKLQQKKKIAEERSR